jgi:hypothetical protein
MKRKNNTKKHPVSAPVQKPTLLQQEVLNEITDSRQDRDNLSKQVLEDLHKEIQELRVQKIDLEIKNDEFIQDN